MFDLQMFPRSMALQVTGGLFLLGFLSLYYCFAYHNLAITLKWGKSILSKPFQILPKLGVQP